ncbi:DUF1569 domain-containing protein [Salegentibacter sp. F188]|uniref:DUF1569 domain-containing protein n=1 Tax=Autumnicola patrickiae TaxID=3075591 RepID=A0ABU3DZK7_9FLAO|nr:DUF1569 domain-containing protein [Salegentibacter sp. F188]MDT0689152.1 DUF1569 domain-containing protein [Salegentibacter sp. F188]
MKTIFDEQIRAELIERVGQINEANTAEWGKMNVYQMLRHNIYWNGWVLGKDNPVYKQAFSGKIFGKIALKRMIRDEKPLAKKIPTSPQFQVKETKGDVKSEKADWVLLIKEYANYNNPDFIHDFFGKMTKEQIGQLVYKHTDHHLRQFGV